MTPQTPPLAYLAIAVLVIGRFLFRELRERKIVLARIFVLPGVLGLIALYLLVVTGGMFPKTLVLLAGETCITAALGSGVGLAVAHFTTVRLGEQPGTVYVLGSWATVATWVGALALRWAVRFALPADDPTANLAANAALVVMVTAALAMVRYRIRYEALLLRDRGITTPVSAV